MLEVEALQSRNIEQNWVVLVRMSKTDAAGLKAARAGRAVGGAGGASSAKCSLWYDVLTHLECPRKDLVDTSSQLAILRILVCP